MIEMFRRFFSVPLVWVTQKQIEDQVYKLPDFVITDELEIDDSNQETQNERENKNDDTDKLNDQKKQSYEIDWMNLDEVEFLPTMSNFYEKTENKDEKVDDAKIEEKLVLSMLTGHLHRFCEKKLKCSVDDLVLEFQRSNTKPEKEHKMSEQEKIMEQKIDNLKSELST